MKPKTEPETVEQKLAVAIRQRDYFAHVAAATRARTAYPQFCKHPDRCANTGRCQADWVCNE